MRLLREDSVGIEFGKKQLRAAAVRPGVPVADEQRLEVHAGGLGRIALLETLLGAGQIAAVDEDFERERQVDSVGCEREISDIQRQARDLTGFARALAEPPDLIAPGAIGKKIQTLAVGGPARRGGVAAGRREPLGP